jgi:hypothetical protein
MAIQEEREGSAIRGRMGYETPRESAMAYPSCGLG